MEPLRLLRPIGLACAPAFTWMMASSCSGDADPKRETTLDLAKAVAAAIDAEDYAAIQGLMVPLEILKEMEVGDEDDIARYAAYREEIPKIAAEYRKYLDKKGQIPLADQEIQATPESRLKTRELNGKKYSLSTGIPIAEDGIPKQEFIDQALRVDGSPWYLLRLCTERIEMEMAEGEEDR